MDTQERRFTPLVILFLVLSLPGIAAPQKVAPGPQATAIVSQASVRKHMEALASDEMRGRGSATADELLAAKYIASQLKLLKIDAAGDNGGFLLKTQVMLGEGGAAGASPDSASPTHRIG